MPTRDGNLYRTASGGLLTGELAGVRSRGSSDLDNYYFASGHASVRVGKGKANRSGTIDPTSDDNIALPVLGTFARVSCDRAPGRPRARRVGNLGVFLRTTADVPLNGLSRSGGGAASTVRGPDRWHRRRIDHGASRSSLCGTNPIRSCHHSGSALVKKL